MDMTTSRRRLLGMFAAVAPAVALAGTSAVARSTATKQDRFLLAMETLHPNGRRAAENALAAGMDPAALAMVFVTIGPNKAGEGLPALMFDMPDGTYRTFRPRGEDS